MPGHAADPRTPPKLIDGVHATYDDTHMWLAPFTASTPCCVNLALPRPATLGAVRLWNYAKSPGRGVRAFSLELDGSLLFEGCLRAAPPRDDPDAPDDFVQTVIFTDNEVLIDAEAEHVYTSAELDDALVVIDNGQRLVLDGQPAGSALERPTTSAGHDLQPRARRAAYGSRRVGM